MQTSVIVPFHKNLSLLNQSLGAIRRSMPDAEILIAADGAREDCHALAREQRAQVVTVPGPQGPAVARNRAAAVAHGDILVFVDTDVVVAPEAIPGMCALLAASPDIAGVFGAYDHQPAVDTFVSQFKNLSHAYVHEVGSPQASTFWAGLGAVRADVFRAVGGFDERFARPSVEDIDLGYRIVGRGHALRLDTRFRGCHLKRWTLWGCVVTDIRARGVPWMQLIHRFEALSNDLNLSVALRLSVVVSYVLIAALALAVVSPWWLLVALAMAGALVGLNLDYYRWFVRERGLWFALRVVPMHLLHHLCNGVSFVIGTVFHLAGRMGLTLPGALPAGTWPPSAPLGTNAGGEIS